MLLAAVVGHVFPLYYQFQGGKGVATAMGAYAVFNPLVAVGGGLIWLAVVYVSRYSSLGSIMMMLALPLGCAWQSGWSAALPLGLCAIIVIYCHKANIQRLLNGTESKSKLRK